MAAACSCRSAWCLRSFATATSTSAWSSDPAPSRKTIELCEATSMCLVLLPVQRQAGPTAHQAG
eukprot:7451315-Pyramimonas_sp.AAC.1